MRKLLFPFLLVPTALLTLHAGCGSDDNGAGPGPDDGGTDDGGTNGGGTDGGSDAADDAAPLGPRWKTLKIGAGGYLTGIDISPDGATKVVRTDTYGAYIRTAGSTTWKQLVTNTSMPADEIIPGLHGPVYELRIAPSKPTRLYMAHDNLVYRSDDSGEKWSRTSFAAKDMPADGYRTNGQKMAVDPANPDVVYVGTAKDGVFVTTDGGATFAPVTSVPASAAVGMDHPGITGIAFDGSSGASGGKTKRIYMGSRGNGVYTSEDAGATWAKTTGGPSSIEHGLVSSDGIYYVVDADGGGDNAWKYAGGTWTNLHALSGHYHTIAVDPQNPAHIVVGQDGGALNGSFDHGATWTGNIAPQKTISTDIPWLAWTNENYMSSGDVVFDPKTHDLHFAEGIGVFTTTPPAASGSYAWKSESAGIEQLVTNDIVAPPGGKPIVGSWDRPVFRVENPDEYPATHGPDNAQAILMGWDVDYASSDPSFIVAVMNWGVEKSGFSTDGGKTWTKFETAPNPIEAGKLGGGIAASTPQNIVWAPNNNGTPAYTKDGGKTWKNVAIDGVPTSGETGFGWAYYFKRHIVAADRVTKNTFYLYNYLKGLYRSSDGGETWTLQRAGELGNFTGYHAKLKAVPGKAGHLFFTAGTQGSATDAHPSGNELWRSTDGGATFTTIPNVNEVVAFAFGKSKSEGGYPAIFIAGWVGKVWGIYRSDDEGASWVKFGDYPLGSLDAISAIEGDMDVAGRCYVGFGGSGYAYYGE